MSLPATGLVLRKGGMPPLSHTPPWTTLSGLEERLTCSTPGFVIGSSSEYSSVLYSTVLSAPARGQTLAVVSACSSRHRHHPFKKGKEQVSTYSESGPEF